MRKLLIAAFLFLNVCLHAQDSAAIKNDTIPASFKGGQTAYLHFLQKHMHNDIVARKGAPPGNYVVVVSYLVDTAGKLSDIQLLQNPGYGAADDVVQLLKCSPNWSPATVNAKPVMHRQK